MVMSWEQLKYKVKTMLDEEVCMKDRPSGFRIIVAVLIIVDFSCIIYCILTNSFLK